MNINYTANPKNLNPEQVLNLFKKSGISKPNWSIERMNRALKGSSIIVCAWHEAHLVGFVNAITDFAWVGYVSQLAVDPTFQHQGIGKNLMSRLVELSGEEISLIVHSADRATDFYRSVGFEPYQNTFKLSRKK